MRVLLFNLATDADDPILGFTTGWIRALAKRVEFIHVITMRAGRIVVPENVEVYSVGKEKGYSEPRRAIEFYRYLFRILRQNKIDACFSHMIPVFSVLAAPALKRQRIPLITWHAHRSLTWILKLAHHLSDTMVTSLPTTYPYLKNKVVVVGQGIDTALFSPDGALPEQPPLILCAGRISPVKDHPTLLRAASILRNRWAKPFRIVIIGEAPAPHGEAYLKLLREQVRELNLQETVYFQPAVKPTELASWYRRCTVHVNLTATGSGDKVAWEAMACGRPCLVANEGFRETLGVYAGGLLFSYSDPGDLAQKLEEVLRLSPMQQQESGIDLRQSVASRHSLEHLADGLVDLFRQGRK